MLCGHAYTHTHTHSKIFYLNIIYTIMSLMCHTTCTPDMVTGQLHSLSSVATLIARMSSYVLSHVNHVTTYTSVSKLRAPAFEEFISHELKAQGILQIYSKHKAGV